MPPEQALYIPDQSVPDPDPCYYLQIANQPDPWDSAWGGHDPEHGRLWDTYCPDALSIALHGPGGGNAIVYHYMSTNYVADGDKPGEGAGVDPMSVVDRAAGKLTIPTPEPNFGPDPTKVAVKVPVWLWVDYDGPIVQTAQAGALTATVTATLEGTTWQMGEPVDPDRPAAKSPAVVCAGGGTPYTAGMDPRDPPCGYTYTWKSLPDRTDGSGTWPVTVTADWTISWAVSSGEAGSQQISTTATVPLLVREWHTVLVDKPGR